jgi:hypothetical protein
MVGTFVTGDFSSPQGQSELASGLVATLLALFGAGVVIWLISRQIHSIPVLNRIILKVELPREDRPGAEPAGIGLLEAMGAAQRSLAPGDIGSAETDLRPAGKAMFGGRVIDVQSVGGYIERGTAIRVVSVGRYVIDVEEAEA